jgi:hypothetical protein
MNHKKFAKLTPQQQMQFEASRFKFRLEFAGEKVTLLSLDNVIFFEFPSFEECRNYYNQEYDEAFDKERACSWACDTIIPVGPCGKLTVKPTDDGEVVIYCNDLVGQTFGVFAWFSKEPACDVFGCDIKFNKRTQFLTTDIRAHLETRAWDLLTFSLGGAQPKHFDDVVLALKS